MISSHDDRFNHNSIAVIHWSSSIVTFFGCRVHRVDRVITAHFQLHDGFMTRSKEITHAHKKTCWSFPNISANAGHSDSLFCSTQFTHAFTYEQNESIRWKITLLFRCWGLKVQITFRDRTLFGSERRRINK